MRTGHDRRDDDLGLIADLGVRTVRYPVLWERTAPAGLERANWSWPDRRIASLRTLGVDPIVGLVHHGSGPRYAPVFDEAFAPGLAAFGAAVARRYPWVTAFTPVNEPLTTARFTGLYGHWFPHRRDAASFIRILLNECRATVLTMEAIRRITPEARLVATEDLGMTTASAGLEYQADHENERRWLSYDLLCGRVDRQHALHPWLRSLGIGDHDLEWFIDHPCPPDILGCNYYVTSERYLDGQLDRWPPRTHGGNDRHCYADVEAVRACGLTGLGRLLDDVWERFRLPIAITEVHLGCTREEQLRWLFDIHAQACNAARAGIPVRAITAWALFGAYDWDSLLTLETGSYESGVFDVRSPEPRKTVLADAVRALARGEPFEHPVLHGHGWWRTTPQPAMAVR